MNILIRNCFQWPPRTTIQKLTHSKYVYIQYVKQFILTLSTKFVFSTFVICREDYPKTKTSYCGQVVATKHLWSNLISCKRKILMNQILSPQFRENIRNFTGWYINWLEIIFNSNVVAQTQHSKCTHHLSRVTVRSWWMKLYRCSV